MNLEQHLIASVCALQISLLIKNGLFHGIHVYTRKEVGICFLLVVVRVNPAECMMLKSAAAVFSGTF